MPLTGVCTEHNSVEERLERWIAADGCPADPAVGETVEGEPGSLGGGHTATLYAWAPCTDDMEVRLLKLTGAGHGWPGVPLAPVREAIVGPATDVIDIEDGIWRFVSRYER